MYNGSNQPIEPKIKFKKQNVTKNHMNTREHMRIFHAQHANFCVSIRINNCTRWTTFHVGFIFVTAIQFANMFTPLV